MATTDAISHLDELEHALKRPTVLLGDTGIFLQDRMVLCWGKEVEALAASPMLEELLATNPPAGAYGDDDVVVAYIRARVNPGLEQCLKEVVNNASDHVVRCAHRRKQDYPTTVAVNAKASGFVVANDGMGVPCDDMTIKGVRGGADLVVPMPSGAFFVFNTSSNYNTETEDTPWGGQNGKGAKLALIFAKTCEVVTQGKRKGKTVRYRHSASRNMRDVDLGGHDLAPAEASPEAKGGKAAMRAVLAALPPRGKTHGVTRVSWTPDMKALKSPGVDLDDAVIQATLRTIVWMAAVACRTSLKNPRGNVAWWFNGVRVPVAALQPAALGALLFGIPPAVGAPASAGAGSEAGSTPAKNGGAAALPVDVVQSADEPFLRLTLVVAPKREGWPAPNVMGIINGLWCPEGSVADLVRGAVSLALRSKIKAIKDLKPVSIHSRLCFFYVAVVNSPTFGQQVKTCLTTDIRRLGFAYSPSTKALNKWAQKGGPIHTLLTDVLDDMTAVKAAKAARSKRKEVTDVVNEGGRRKKTVKVEKLTDAGQAGTAKWKSCMLILTEGDSAAGGVLPAFDLDLTGVFALKGTPINLLISTDKEIAANKEFQQLMAALGIEPKELKDYTVKGSTLRYGRVCYMTDVDDFGRKFIGQIMANIVEWNPTVAAAFPDLFCGIMTPLISVRPKGSKHLVKDARFFFSEAAFVEWKAAPQPGTGAPPNLLTYDIAFYKGLGVLSDEEMAHFCADNRALLTYDLGVLEETRATWRDWLEDDSEKRKAMWRAGGANFGLEAINYDERFAGGRTLDVVKDVFGVDYPTNMKHALERNMLSVDGLKATQRKVMAAMLMAAHTAKWSKSMHKVYMILAYVVQCAAYHHGEASLQTVFYNMADHLPNGFNLGFITRGGNHGKILNYKPAAARYAEAKPARHILTFYPAGDMDVAPRVFEDGELGEPDAMLGVLPLAAVNANSGIGSGWNANFLPRDPLAVAMATAQVIAFLGAALPEAANRADGVAIDATGGVTGVDLALPDFRAAHPDPAVEALRLEVMETLTTLQDAIHIENWDGVITREEVAGKDGTTFPRWKAEGRFHWVSESAVCVTELPPNTKFINWKTKMEKKAHVREVQNKKVGVACVTAVVRFDPAWAAKAPDDKVAAELALHTYLKNNPNVLAEEPTSVKDKDIVDYGDLVTMFSVFSLLRLRLYAARKAYSLGCMGQSRKVMAMRLLYIESIIDGSLPDPRTVTKDGMKEAMDDHEPPFLVEADLAPPPKPAEVLKNVYLGAPVWDAAKRYDYILNVMKTTDLTKDEAARLRAKDAAVAAEVEAAAASHITDTWEEELRAATKDLVAYLEKRRAAYAKEAKARPATRVYARKVTPARTAPAPKRKPAAAAAGETPTPPKRRRRK